MRIIFLATLLVFTMASNVWAQALPGNVYDTPPFNANPKYFMSTNCRPKFKSDQATDDTAMTTLANRCASQNFGFPAGTMSKLVNRGTYKGCVIPGSYAKQGPGFGAKAQWPVCCVKDGTNEMSEMICNFYITNEAQ